MQYNDLNYSPSRFLHTSPSMPTVTRYYSTFLIHWTRTKKEKKKKTFNFPATTEAGAWRGEEERGGERSAAALNWFCCEGPMRALAGVAEPQSGAITPGV